MTEEELLKHMTITDDKVIFDKEFYVDIVVSCMNNAVNKTKLISFLEDKIKEYKNKLNNIYETHNENDVFYLNIEYTHYIRIFQEVLDFVNKGGKNE